LAYPKKTRASVVKRLDLEHEMESATNLATSKKTQPKKNQEEKSAKRLPINQICPLEGTTINKNKEQTIPTPRRASGSNESALKRHRTRG
jgi:hypothetical protein